MRIQETLSMVVDTDQHAGICSRALVVYVTGRLDERSYQEGVILLPIFKKEMGIGDNVHEAGYPFDDLIESRLVNQGDIADRAYSDICGDGLRSVRIFLSRMPTKEEWETLKQRAFALEKIWEKVGKYGEGLKITGVRLVKTTTTVTEEEDYL